MKPQAPTLALKSGTPVYHYRGGKPQSLYIGGRIGNYRLLTLFPHSESGICVHMEEFPLRVYPAPNEHGVFPTAVCSRISVSLDRRLTVEICYVQSGPRAWCAAVSKMVVGDNYRSSPVSERDVYPTLEAALGAVLPPLLMELRELANGTDAQLQRRHSLPKCLYGKTRRFGAEAVYSIISEIPRDVASDILNSLNRRN